MDTLTEPSDSLIRADDARLVRALGVEEEPRRATRASAGGAPER